MWTQICADVKPAYMTDVEKEENRKGYLIRQKRKKKERKMLRKANKARNDVGNNGT